MFYDFDFHYNDYGCELYFCPMSRYKTMAKLSSGEFKDRGSKFIGYAKACYSEEDAKLLIADLWKDNHKACHVCYAYKIGLDNPIIRINDDGEPSNTGGQPIMNYINKYELDNIVIAVVRYFGGTLLGKGGLINAYGNAADFAIQNGKISNRSEKIILNLSLPFDNYALVVDSLKKMNVTFLGEDFDTNCHFEIQIEKEHLEQLEEKLSEFKIDSLKLKS
jgi:uncharacterized YigZ family protein